MRAGVVGVPRSSKRITSSCGAQAPMMGRRRSIPCRACRRRPRSRSRPSWRRSPRPKGKSRLPAVASVHHSSCAFACPQKSADRDRASVCLASNRLSSKRIRERIGALGYDPINDDPRGKPSGRGASIGCHISTVVILGRSEAETREPSPPSSSWILGPRCASPRMTTFLSRAQMIPDTTLRPALARSLCALPPGRLSPSGLPARRYQ